MGGRQPLAFGGQAVTPKLRELISEAIDLGAPLPRERDRERLVQLIREAYERGQIDERREWVIRPKRRVPSRVEEGR